MNDYTSEKGDLYFISIILLVILSYALFCLIFKEYLEWIITFTIVIGIFDYLVVVGATKN